MTSKTLWRKFVVKITNFLGGNSYLCDSCVHDYRSCNDRDRPNVTRCPNYRARY